MAIVQAKPFTFTYAGAEKRTLDDVSFAIERGEVIGIIGPMGAGKTILCMAVAGFVPRILGGQATGTLEVAGHDWREEPGDRRHRPVGMVFDYEGQLTQLRVLDEVMTPLLHGGASEQEAQERARQLLARMGLGGEALEGRQVWELSGGQQQRLAIAAMLALDPQVLIFDDAMTMLDPRGQEEVRSLITDLAGTKTLVVVEQDAELMQTVERNKWTGHAKATTLGRRQ